jgi:hypothetical protein
MRAHLEIGSIVAVVLVAQPLVSVAATPEVIKVFIETSPIAMNVSAGDVIALKNHGATDDITTALLKRGAQARARAADAVARAAAFLRGSATLAGSVFGPFSQHDKHG